MELYTLQVGSIEENCYILGDDEKNAAVEDPGDQADEIAGLAEQHGLTVRLILLTHGHFDHIGAVKELAARWGVPVYAGASEQQLLGSARLNRAGFHFGDDSRFEITADRWLQDGETFSLDELDFEVIATPGHTAGGVCYRCGDLLFTGDTLFAGDIGRCDLYGGDYDAMLRSLDKLKALPGNPRVLPGHGPKSWLEDERTGNPYMTGEAL